MNYQIYPRLLSVTKNITLMMVLYSLSRFAFWLVNYTSFTSFSFIEIASVFIIGLRFDLATVVLLSGPYILFSLVPFRFYFSRIYQNALKLLFLVCHLPLFLLHVGDIEYFKFTGSRMTSGLMALQSEIKNQLDQFIVHYWHMTIFSVLCIIIVYKLFNIAKQSTQKRGNPLKYIAFIFLTLAIAVISVRGGLQKKVLQPSYAFLVAEDQLAILALNSSFTILKTNARDQIKPIKYYNSWPEVYAQLEKPSFTYPGHKNQNVVVIILESFATEFWGIANGGEGYTPFLDSLAAKGLFFRNHFADGRRSIEAVPSIVFSLPSLMDHPLAKSKFQFNIWHGIGEQLEANNYHTSFFHAAEKGSMYFDAVTALGGIEDYYAFEDYPEPEDTDGHWGIFDEPFLQYMIKEINGFKKPFFSIAFTLSSHQPYPIPPQYKDRFKKGPTPLHEGIGYVDHALELFFKEASKEPWFKDTLFILTGDHTQMSPSVNYDTIFGRYMVPLLVYHPSIELKANTNKVVHQADIMPTILDFLDIENPQTTLFGRPIWQSDSGRAVFQLNGTYHLIKDSLAIVYDSNKQTYQYYRYTDPNSAQIVTDLPESQQLELKNELMAFIQYYNNGMNENKLYDWMSHQ